MLIKAKTIFTDTADALTLTGNDDLIVGAGVILSSTFDDAVVGTGLNQSVTINGMLLARYDAINLNAPGVAGGGRATIFIGKDAVLQARETGVDLVNQSFDIVNNGVISAVYGFEFSFDIITTSHFTNTGRILAIDGMTGNYEGRLIFENTGRMVGQRTAYDNFGGGEDVILNKGYIWGTVYGGRGDDVINTLNGRIDGTVFGGAGDDRFAPGRFRDVFDGGSDLDTLDFRGSAGVKIALDGAFAATGVAAGDTYTSIEVLQGSRRGADVLRGAERGETLYGNGGNDRLIGMGGEDILSGGAGRDTLAGGAGDDFFILGGPSAGADVISDFAGVTDNNDLLVVNPLAFKGVNLNGDGFFHAGRSNLAQDRSDRFIFRTGDETLWFDADGKGGKGPVLIADFNDGVRLTADDFMGL